MYYAGAVHTKPDETQAERLRFTCGLVLCLLFSVVVVVVVVVVSLLFVLTSLSLSIYIYMYTIISATKVLYIRSKFHISAEWSAFRLTHAVSCFFSSEIMTCRWLKFLSDNPTKEETC